jgi:hypothetical protein
MFFNNFTFNSFDKFNFNGAFTEQKNVSPKYKLFKIFEIKNKSLSLKKQKLNAPNIDQNEIQPVHSKTKIPGNQKQSNKTNRPVNLFSPEELEQTFNFIEDYVHLGIPGAKEAFEKLTLNSKKFLNEYLLYNFDRLPKNLEFIILTGQFKKKKRRKEEMNKILYKNVLKILRNRFMRKHCQIVTRTMGTTFEKYFKNPNVGFFVWLFKNTINKNRENIDFIIDVCLEKFGTKSKKFSREMGWIHSKKYTAMKNISSTFRYLLKHDEPCRNKFLDLFQSLDEEGLLAIYKNKIQRNLKEKFNLLKNELIAVGNDFDNFIFKFRDIVTLKTYKNPWLLETIKDSISYCVIELTHEYSEARKKGKYRDISKDYQIMKKLHYTSTE